MKKIKMFVHRHARTVLPFCFVFLLLFFLTMPAYAATDDVTISGKWELYYIDDYVSDDGFDSHVYEIFSTGSFTFDGKLYDAGSYPLFTMRYDSYSQTLVFSGFTQGYWDGEEFDPLYEVYVSDLKVGSILDCQDSSFTCSAADFALFTTMFRQVAPAGDDVVKDIFPIFAGIGAWIVGAISGVMPMFYTEAEGLTFLGTLAVSALAIAVILLLVVLVKRFFQFRG